MIRPTFEITYVIKNNEGKVKHENITELGYRVKYEIPYATKNKLVYKALKLGIEWPDFVKNYPEEFL